MILIARISSNLEIPKAQVLNELNNIMIKLGMVCPPSYSNIVTTTESSKQMFANFQNAAKLISEGQQLFVDIYTLNAGDYIRHTIPMFGYKVISRILCIKKEKITLSTGNVLEKYHDVAKLAFHHSGYGDKKIQPLSSGFIKDYILNDGIVCPPGPLNPYEQEEREEIEKSLAELREKKCKE